MRQQVITDRHRLRALKVGVARDQPVRVAFCLESERVDEIREEQERLTGRVATVEPQVEGDLVVARPAGVK